MVNLLEVAPGLKYKAALSVAYGAGLRDALADLHGELVQHPVDSGPDTEALDLGVAPGPHGLGAVDLRLLFGQFGRRRFAAKLEPTVLDRQTRGQLFVPRALTSRGAGWTHLHISEKIGSTCLA